MNIRLKGDGTLTRVREGVGEHWVFLPGGPGLGAECFRPLFDGWKTRANLWTLDYCRSKTPARWRDSVLDLRGRLDRMILVGHSYGGMLLLMIPDLEEHLGDAVNGWVFLDSSPSLAVWRRLWRENKQSAVFPEAMEESGRLEREFAKKPSAALYRKLFQAWAPYYFERSSLAEGRELLKGTTYRPHAYALAEETFKSYDARWLPRRKTLIVAGHNDRVTPIECFTSDPRFKRPNVRIVSIPAAGHFPWIECLQNVIGVFESAFPAR
jgi:pimeloyl-ACP methyl ester carboxylesterase